MNPGTKVLRLLVFAATCALASMATAQVEELDEVDRSMGGNVGLLVERIELDAAVAGRLLMGHPELGDSSELRAAAQKAIADGHGEIAEASYLLARSGNRAKLESILDFRYPSKWQPPTTPKKITGPVAAGTVLGLPTTPSHFVTRPLGSAVELDPVIEFDGRTVSYTLAAETVRLAAEESFGRGLSRVTTPRLDVQKWSTKVRSRIGTTTLIAAQRIDRKLAGGGRTALVFVTTKHQVLEASAEERVRIEKQIKIRGPREADGTVEDPFATVGEGDSDSGVVDDPFGLAGTTKSGGGAPYVDPFDTSAPAPGYPPGQPKWSMLRTGFEAIEVDRERFAELIGTLGKYANSTPLRDALEADLDKGSAQMIASTTVPTRSGQRARVESAKEHLHPTDFRPLEFPEEVVAPPAGNHSSYTAPAMGGGFQMQPEGTILEIDAVVGADERTIDVTIAPTISQLAREISYGRDEAEVVLPLFAKIRLMGTICVNAGDDLLLAAITPRHADTGAPQSDRRVLLFLRTDIIDGPTPEESTR